LGNDWLRRMKTNLNWDNSKLSIKHGRKIVTILIICTKKHKNVEVESSESDESSDEFEEEETQEVPIYFSDSSDSDLEFNPWKDHVTPSQSEESEEEDELDNPAVFLAQAQTEGILEGTPNLNLGPLDAHQQQLFQDLLKEYKDLCAKSQTEIGRTDLIKHRIITGDALLIAQQPY